ncbi:lysozyme inhibitor LprI family protein [Enterovirga rhinocerotis]|uniref:Lysozyme inhibitor LprI N-terminal domain-containing protein n=1 Tax=Enterovirga rhinocerotis TaxID=1339210 RepID=A0A4R7C8N3_9HYPH|nr:hypothetical protein [Enterovirga rhinocerotis]TDR94741.1 hypothetical protein EV668_2029 [Enterovirga rhinocerotis]
MHERFDGALRRLLFAAAIGAAPLAASSGASAASFDCKLAALPAEKAICGNANLSRLDDSTAGMYLLIVGSGAPAATMSRVKQAQTKFLQTRNACGTDIDCLVDAYTSQMMFLRNEKSNLGL